MISPALAPLPQIAPSAPAPLAASPASSSGSTDRGAASAGEPGSFARELRAAGGDSAEGDAATTPPRGGAAPRRTAESGDQSGERSGERSGDKSDDKVDSARSERRLLASRLLQPWSARARAAGAAGAGGAAAAGGTDPEAELTRAAPKFPLPGDPAARDGKNPTADTAAATMQVGMLPPADGALPTSTPAPAGAGLEGARALGSTSPAGDANSAAVSTALLTSGGPNGTALPTPAPVAPTAAAAAAPAGLETLQAQASDGTRLAASTASSHLPAARAQGSPAEQSGDGVLAPRLTAPEPKASDTGAILTQGSDAAEGKGASASGATPAGATPLPHFATELARASQGVAAASAADAGAGGAAQLALQTPVHSPEFMPRLAGELQLLARNGVQEARVQVHPAELGPIAVQITVDGNAAQIRLAADSALTRDVLQQGLPTLAAALRDSGLTLTGGGVFQHARDSARDDRGDGQAARPGRAQGVGGVEAGGAEAVAAPVVRRLRHPGQIDVFA